MDYIIRYFIEFWEISCKMAPWLLFGFLMAGVLSIVFKPAFVEKHLGGNRFGSIVKAALFGVPLPLCSCGVVPVALSLKKQGAGKGATASFLISTPQTGVDSFLVTWSMLGWVFAVFKVVVAFIAGVVGGSVVEFFDKDTPEQKSANASAEADDTDKIGNKFIHIFKYGFGQLFDKIAMMLLVGLAIAAAISLLIPTSWLTGYHGSYLVSMLVMLVVGIPLYVCSTSSVPIAAALMLKGMSPGAALVFLIAGPATNAATLAAMTKILGRRSTVIYLVSLAIMIIGAGLLLDYISVAVPDSMAIHGTHEPGIIHQLSGGLLLALIALSAAKSLMKKFKGQPEACCCGSVPENTIRLKVPDMTCEHCSNSVQSALKGIANIENAEVCLSSKTVTVSFSGTPELDTVMNAIKDAGFSPEIV